jgi:hypothetical protein
MSFWKWSKTAASNATADGNVNWAEGMAPSAVNDSARAMMAALAKWRDDNAGTLTTGGTSTAFAVSTNQVFDALATMHGQSLRAKFHAANGAAPTINVDGLGARPLVTAAGVALGVGTIQANAVHDLVYDNALVHWVVVGTGYSQFASGTRMLFQQTAAPTGWTKDVSHDNKALRLVNGPVGTGGSSAFTNVFGARTITQGNLPNVGLTGTPNSPTQPLIHTVGGNSGYGLNASISAVAFVGTSGANAYNNGAFSGMDNHTVTFPNYSVPLGGSGIPMDFAVQYLDVIIAAKD